MDQHEQEGVGAPATHKAESPGLTEVSPPQMCIPMHGSKILTVLLIKSLGCLHCSTASALRLVTDINPDGPFYVSPEFEN